MFLRVALSKKNVKPTTSFDFSCRLRHFVKIDYEISFKLNKLKISDCNFLQSKLFRELLFQNTVNVLCSFAGGGHGYGLTFH